MVVPSIPAALVLAALVGQTSASAPSDRMSALKELAGCWSVQAAETNTVGEVLHQIGAIRVRTTPTGEAVELSFELVVTEATGLYADVPERRSFREELTFDATSSLLSIATVRPSSPAPARSTAALSEDGRNVFRTFLFYHPARRITLFGEDRWSIVSSDEVSNTTEIGDVFGDYHETFRATWRRVASDDERCQDMELRSR